ncbi:MAG: response regulator [Bacteroidota bacterium]
MRFYLFPFLLVLILVSTTRLQAQKEKLDVYYMALEDANGTRKVDLMLDIINKLRVADRGEAQKLAKEALKLSNSLKYTEGLIKSNYYLGILERDRGRYNRAISATEEGLNLAKSSRNTEEILMGNKLMQTIYMLKQDLETATAYQNSYKLIRDSLSSLNLTKELNQLQEELEVEKSNTEAALTESKNIETELRANLMEEENKRIQQEMEIMKLERESAELEKQAMENMMLLNKKIAEEEKTANQRNLAIAGVIVSLLGILGIFLWFRVRQQRRRAQIEKERREKMEQVDQLKDQFLANTSHELRTPLNGIIGLAESLEDRATNEFQEENLSMIISSARRLSSLVDDILDFSRIRNQEVRLNAKAIDPYALVEMIVKLNQPLAKKKRLNLSHSIPKDIPAIHGDENRLQQILHNLVGNAIKFTHKGFIEVSAEAIEDKLWISVADSGIGIEKDKHSSIFLEFSQADASISRTYNGSGLGLSISKKLVELHEGELIVESEPEEGSVFSFSIPLSWEKVVEPMIEAPLVSHLVEVDPVPETAGKRAPKKVIETGALAQVINGKGHFKILIVDDEPVNQQVFQNHFLDQAFETHSALNGEQALKILEQEGKFDLVLLDVMMPRMTGYEVCKHIRKQYSASELPVIMVTAKNQVQDLVEGLSTGANDYLAKPFSKDELLARVKTHLNLYSINSATGRFVPYQFLRALGKDNITEVHLGDHVSKDVSVFFSDIRRYTTLAEQMTPEENFRFVNSYAGRMGPVIQKNKGFVNQYMGDGIMAIFQDKAEDAVKAAIEMQRIIREYNAERIQMNRTPLEVGMGIHTGPLVMGIIGDSKRTEPATISDTVNLASRMEGLTKFYGSRLLLSEDTFKGLKETETFAHRFLGKVQVKGKEQAIGVYEIFDLKGNPLDKPKWENRDKFNSALKNYYLQNFQVSQNLFEEIILQNPLDKAAQFYLKRSQEYRQNGAPEAWSGVEMMQTK